jgi:hypothetical protein
MLPGYRPFGQQLRNQNRPPIEAARLAESIGKAIRTHLWRPPSGRPPLCLRTGRRSGGLKALADMMESGQVALHDPYSAIAVRPCRSNRSIGVTGTDNASEAYTYAFDPAGNYFHVYVVCSFPESDENHSSSASGNIHFRSAFGDRHHRRGARGQP